MSRHEEPDNRRTHDDPDFRRETEFLLDFRRRIDRILIDRGKSPAAGTSPVRTPSAPPSCRGFAAADDLMAAYDAVRRRLERFSRALGEQPEALDVAAQTADRGYGASRWTDRPASGSCGGRPGRPGADIP